MQNATQMAPVVHQNEPLPYTTTTPQSETIPRAVHERMVRELRLEIQELEQSNLLHVYIKPM